MMEKINLYGAGCHGKVVLDILQENGIVVETIFDDVTNEKYLKGVLIKRRPVQFPLIISIGDNAARKRIATALKATNFGTAVSKSAIVARTASIDVGTVVMQGAIIQSSTTIEKHVIVNTGSTIDHDCIIHDYVHIAPGCNLCGGIEVGEGTLVGVGTVVIPKVKIGKWCTIGAGSVVTKDIPDYTVAVGSPCKVIKSNVHCFAL